MSEAAAPAPGEANAGGELARTGRAVGGAALVLMAANLSGSVLGYARSAVMGAVFGETRGTDAFLAASLVPQMFYDLTIGAAVSAALIPVFTEIAHRDGRAALARQAGSVLVLAWLVLLAVVGVLVLLARPLMVLLLAQNHQQYHAAAIDESVRIVRILLPTLFFLGTSAVLLSSLYAVRRFTVSAFAPGLYHLGIIVAALAAARPLGILALPAGALAGAAAQAAVQGPAFLRWVGAPTLRLQITPELKRLMRLYGPVAAGLVISLIGQGIDIGFKWELGKGAVTSMSYATFLTQFPIGIAVAGLSFAILPSLSLDAADERLADFKNKLSAGIRLAFFLTLPAAIGFLTLAVPIAALIFQHGNVSASDTERTAEALRGYAIQIPFVGLDQLLIFAFYARKNTLTPALVGVLGVGIYVVSALLLKSRYHVFGLALANTLQNSLHGAILLVILLAAIGSLRGTGILLGLLRTTGAAAVMAGGVLALSAALGRLGTHGSAGRLLDAGVPIAAGVVLYLGVAAMLRSEEVVLLRDVVVQRLGRG